MCRTKNHGSADKVLTLKQMFSSFILTHNQKVKLSDPRILERPYEHSGLISRTKEQSRFSVTDNHMCRKSPEYMILFIIVLAAMLVLVLPNVNALTLSGQDNVKSGDNVTYVVKTKEPFTQVICYHITFGEVSHRNELVTDESSIVKYTFTPFNEQLITCRQGNETDSYIISIGDEAPIQIIPEEKIIEGVPFKVTIVSKELCRAAFENANDVQIKLERLYENYFVFTHVIDKAGIHILNVKCKDNHKRFAFALNQTLPKDMEGMQIISLDQARMIPLGFNIFWHENLSISSNVFLIIIKGALVVMIIQLLLMRKDKKSRWKKRT